MNIPDKQYANMVLKVLIGEQNIEVWWNSSNRALDGLSPNEVWKTDSKKVTEYLQSMIGGDFS
jgi:hypothetical protein